MPLAGAIKEIVTFQFTGASHWNSFYTLLFAPLGVLFMLFSPGIALLGFALIALHLTVAGHHGVDRSWIGHVHHMAPTVAFLSAALAVGIGRIIRLINTNAAGLHQIRGAAAALFALGLVLYSTNYTMTWAQTSNLRVTMQPLEPTWENPAWELVRQLPEDAIPIVPNEVSIAVSNRTVSYTYRESLLDKARDRGMGAGTHLIVNNKHKKIQEWGLQMAGAKIIATSGNYTLLTWDEGAKDPTLPREPNLGLPRPGERSTGRDKTYPGLINLRNTPDR